MYCRFCKKEVVFFSVSSGAMPEDEIRRIRSRIESEGKVVLFNPPPIGPHRCPNCHNQLEEDT